MDKVISLKETKIKNYVAFKFDQYCRITGIDTKDEMTDAMNNNMASWVKEAIAIVK